MPLNIRDPRVHQLASKLARRRGMTMTAVIAEALEKEDKIDMPAAIKHMKELHRDIAANSKPGGHRMTKAEIDAMWGHK